MQIAIGLGLTLGLAWFDIWRLAPDVQIQIAIGLGLTLGLAWFGSVCGFCLDAKSHVPPYGCVDMVDNHHVTKKIFFSDRAGKEQGNLDFAFLGQHKLQAPTLPRLTQSGESGACNLLGWVFCCFFLH